MKNNIAALAVALLAAPIFAAAQGFYDPKKIQEIRIHFAQANWDFQLDTTKAGAGGYLLADSVVINGQRFENCGVKYKGNSSYDASRAKNPLHIELDYEKNQDYEGFTDLKLGNGWSDNSMIREPLAYSILGKYMDAPQGNFAKVWVNGAYYGLMNSAESIGKRFVLHHFFSSKNAFFKCNPISIGSGLGSGSNLSFLGNDPSKYEPLYELKSDAGWGELAGLCDTLNNQFSDFQQVADLDRFLWMLAFNNATVNLDSYSGAFRQNYYLYRSHSGAWLPVVWDLNMCFGGFGSAGGTAGALTPATMPTMSHTLHKSESGWPLIFKILNEPTFLKMYLAHLRTINNENFANGDYKILAAELHGRIDAEVKNDPNFLSNYADFQVALTQNTPGANGAGTSPGLFSLMDARANYLKNVLSAAPPIIANPAVVGGDEFGKMATVTAAVSSTTAVFIGFRQRKQDRFVRVAMSDDGLHGDGAAGDGVFGAAIPVQSAAVQYYFFAENGQTGAFLPERAEHEYFEIRPKIEAAKSGEIALNELTADNSDGIRNEQGKIRDWLEIVNLTDRPLSLAQIFIANDAADLQRWQFSENAFLAPHERLLVWADDLDEELLDHHLNFNFKKTGETVVLSDGTTVFDQLIFGSQTPNRAMARCPDGTGVFKETLARTPRAANLCVSSSGEAAGFPPVKISPNPTANGFFQIETDERLAAVEVFSADGRLCFFTENFSENAVEKNLVDVSALPSGVFSVKILLADGRATVRRWIKI